MSALAADKENPLAGTADPGMRKRKFSPNYDDEKQATVSLVEVSSHTYPLPAERTDRLRTRPIPVHAQPPQVDSPTDSAARNRWYYWYASPNGQCLHTVRQVD